MRALENLAQDLRYGARTFLHRPGFNYATRNLTGIDEPLEARTARVSATLLPLLGVRPALGRNFSQDENYKDRDQVAILSDEMWRQHFGADPNVAGRSITLDGRQ